MGIESALDPHALQQHSQFACAPARPLQAQFYDPRLDHLSRAAWTPLRPPAVLPHTGHALFPESLQPQIPGGPRDRELPAQAAQALTATGTNHELHPLLQHSHKPPRHLHLTRPFTLRCKESPDNNL
ncbi:MAG: hypothetical protein ABSG47_01480 [Terracidiphilus sp.]